MSNFRDSVGERIFILLRKNHKKQVELAKCLDVTANTVSLYCSGQRTPNTEQIVKISKFFGVSADYLLGLTDVAYPEYAIDVDGFLKKCKESADTVRKCLDKLMNNDKTFDCQAYAFFETKLRIYEYDIPGLVKEYLTKRSD